MWDFILIQIICRTVWWKNPWKTLSATIFELLFATSNRTMSPFSFPICPTLVYFILLTWLPDKKSCGQKCSNPIVESSWNRRIIKVTMLEVTSKVHGVQPFLGQRALIKLSSTMSNCIWKTSTDRDTNTPLGILFKWRVVLPVKKFFLIFDRFCGLCTLFFCPWFSGTVGSRTENDIPGVVWQALRGLGWSHFCVC